MRILESTEIDQVAGGGLLGLNLNVLDLVGVNARVDLGCDDRRGGGHGRGGHRRRHGHRGRRCD